MAKYSITPKETSYAGCLFRSRLEARWAVFFDTLGIRWEYEPDRYSIGPDYRYYHGKEDVGCAWWHLDKDSFSNLSDEEKLKCVPIENSYTEYLPDFYLPKFDTWVDVKGVYDEKDSEITRASVDYGLLPIHRQSDLYREDKPFDTNGILYLGDIPDPTARNLRDGYLLFQNYKGPVSEVATFGFFYGEIILNRTIHWNGPTPDNSTASEIEKYIQNGIISDYIKGIRDWLFDPSVVDTSRVRLAYAKARSYRFGERGYK